MKISRKEVEHVADLARLKLTEQEIELYTEQLNSILEYAAKLQQIDTTNVEPTAHAVQLYNVLREDEITDSMETEKVFENAPWAEDGYFRVPKIV
ncbi:MAG: Asp-tRNA(Asn)/Glu-tRNA(Gln) amidotransferase subunit GatC [Peptococcaceae bacterium]|nr:Asp-tRNA(Asn)/Glu-tRNA(Gln) amidotransferase subunit GatC [Peptococcaceae bacterium]